MEDPAEELTVAQACSTPLGEVERAITEARRSFDAGVWSDMPALQRAEMLQANPTAEIQLKGDHLAVIARTATAEEKHRLWQLMVDAWPNYDTYQSRTDRDIPVVVLSPQPR